jgi:hypothetical protein
MGLERSALSLASIIEELLWRKSSGSGLEIWEYGRREPSCWSRSILYPQKLEPTLSTRGDWYSSLADSGHGVCCFEYRTIIPKLVTTDYFQILTHHSNWWKHIAYISSFVKSFQIMTGWVLQTIVCSTAFIPSLQDHKVTENKCIKCVTKMINLAWQSWQNS